MSARASSERPPLWLIVAAQRGERQSFTWLLVQWRKLFRACTMEWLAIQLNYFDEDAFGETSRTIMPEQYQQW
jgi:hypothetical protein